MIVKTGCGIDGALHSTSHNITRLSLAGHEGYGEGVAGEEYRGGQSSSPRSYTEAGPATPVSSTGYLASMQPPVPPMPGSPGIFNSASSSEYPYLSMFLTHSYTIHIRQSL